MKSEIARYIRDVALLESALLFLGSLIVLVATQIAIRWELPVEWSVNVAAGASFLLFFLLFVFVVAIDNGPWLRRALILYVLVQSVSLLVLYLYVGQTPSLQSLLLLVIGMPVAVLGGALGNRLRSRTKSWTFFSDHIRPLANPGSRGLLSFWRGERSFVDFLRFIVIGLGFLYIVVALVLLYGLSNLFDFSTRLLAAVLISIAFGLYFFVCWFRCAPNVKSISAKFIAQGVGFVWATLWALKSIMFLVVVIWN